MKKVIGLTIVFLLAISLVSSGVWAFFADIETSNAGIVAGILDLLPATGGGGPDGKYTVTPGGDKENGKVVFQSLIPGESGNITWTLENIGTVPGTLVISSTVTFLNNTTTIVEALATGNDLVNGDLGTCVGVKLERGVGTDQASAVYTYVLGAAGTYYSLNQLQTYLNNEINIAMAANGGNDTIVYRLTWYINTDVKKAGADFIFGTADDVDVNENIIQSDSAKIDITFTVTQS
jgi:predicted ribosomally synthesized peptide with SipW-like signal peptide